MNAAPTELDETAPWKRIAASAQPWVYHWPLAEGALDAVKATFDDLGYVIVRGAYSEDELTALQDDLTRVHDASMRGELDPRHTAPEIEPKNPTVIDGITFKNIVVYATEASPVADEMIKSQPIELVGRHLMGEGPTYIYDYDRHGVMYLDARGASSYQGLSWHADWESTPQLPIWPAVVFTINLDATSPENGFLRMVPGSHRVELGERPAGFERIPGEVAVYCERGDLLFHHSHLVHSACRPSGDSTVRRHIRGKWCPGEPIPAGAWDGTFNNSATKRSGRGDAVVGAYQ
jgi:ectoine hydroxylase-related dioxygenase (phytanoyl-CoA dioxygenase family)